MNRPHILAFLVAIDDYYNGIKPLKGCVTGLQSMTDYLEQHSNADEYELRVTTLLNHEATRAAIISGFELFSQANDGDICLFYFSGHGSFFPAPQFWESYDGYNQCIVCADSSLTDGKNDLIDKELSWLIHEATKHKKIHFVALMDCCFSGAITRANTDDLLLKFTASRIETKKIEDYLGYKDYIQNSDGQWSVPKGSHILLSACRSDQPAACIYILGDRSAFTHCLLEVLRTSKQIFSYPELESAVALAINRYLPGHVQSPLFSSIGGANIHTTFLKNAVTFKRNLFIAWNERSGRWELNAGRLTGISETSVIESREFFKFHSPKINIQEVLLDKTIITEIQSGSVELLYPVKIHPGKDNLKIISLARVSNPLTKFALLKRFNSQHALLSNDPHHADFVVTSHRGQLALCDASSLKPLFSPVMQSTCEKSSVEFWFKTECVLKWEYLLGLENPASTIRPNEFELELWHSEGGDWTVEQDYERVVDWRTPPSFQWKEVGGNKLAPGYMLNIKNCGNRDLYFSALHLSARFGIESMVLPDGKLLPGRNAWIEITDEFGTSSRTIGLTIDDLHQQAGIREMKDYIKIIIADRSFNTLSLDQTPLDLLPLTRDTVRKNEESSGCTDPYKFGKVESINWITACIPLQIIKNI